MNDYGIITLVQCRWGSHRLEGKALRPIAGKPMLAHVLERAKAIGFPVVLATSVNAKDDPIAELGESQRVAVHRGDEQDVLGRMSEAARKMHARIAIRVTGDCPLFAPDVGISVLESFCQSGPGFIVTNDTRTSGWPDGMDVEVFHTTDLHAAAEQATSAEDREHVTTWIRRRLQHIVFTPPPIEPPKCKLSVDHQQDFNRVVSIYEELKPGELGWRATFAAARKVEHDKRQQWKAGKVPRNGRTVTLPPRAAAALKRERLNPQAAAAMSDEQLLAISGVGAATVAMLREAYGQQD